MQYAYRNIARESGNTQNRWHRWVADYVQSTHGEHGWLLHTCKQGGIEEFSVENCGQFYGFYTNFFVAELAMFQTPEARTLLQALDDSGLMFTARWGDLLIQSLAVQLFVPSDAVHHFTGWSYAHNSGKPDGMHYGIVQIGRNVSNPLADLTHVLANVLGWDPARYAKDLLWVDGMLTLAKPSLFPVPERIQRVHDIGWVCYE